MNKVFVIYLIGLILLPQFLFAKNSNKINPAVYVGSAKLYTPLCWKNHKGYFAGQDHGDKLIIVVDSSFNEIARKKITEKIDRCTYFTCVNLGDKICLFYFKNIGKNDFEVLRSEVSLESLENSGPLIHVYSSTGNTEFSVDTRFHVENPIGNYFQLIPSVNHKYLMIYSKIYSKKKKEICVTVSTYRSGFEKIGQDEYVCNDDVISIEQCSIDDKGDAFFIAHAYHKYKAFHLIYISSASALQRLDISVKDKFTGSVYGLSTAKHELITCIFAFDSSQTINYLVRFYSENGTISKEYSHNVDKSLSGKYEIFDTKKIGDVEFGRGPAQLCFEFRIVSARYLEDTKDLIIVGEEWSQVTNNLGTVDESKMIYVSILSESEKSNKDYKFPRVYWSTFSAYGRWDSFSNGGRFEIYQKNGKFHLLCENDLLNFDTTITAPAFGRQDQWGVIEYTFDNNGLYSSEIIYQSKPEDSHVGVFALSFYDEEKEGKIVCFWKRGFSDKGNLRYKTSQLGFYDLNN